MATEKDTLHEAIYKAQHSFKPALKDTNNPFFKSKYADLTSIWEACKDGLSVNGLFVSQSTDIAEIGPVLITRIYHSSGEFIESKTPIICAKTNDPQAFGSAMTYTRRYALAAILGIITDDDDGEGAIARTANKPPEAMANPEQIAIIRELLKNDVISPDEERKTQSALNSLTYIKAADTILKIQATIESRSKDATQSKTN